MKKLLIVLVVLIALTLITAIISNVDTSYTVIAILFLAVLKFIGVSFYFMEIKQAHSFWKTSLLIFLGLFSATVLIIM